MFNVNVLDLNAFNFDILHSYGSDDDVLHLNDFLNLGICSKCCRFVNNLYWCMMFQALCLYVSSVHVFESHLSQEVVSEEHEVSTFGIAFRVRRETTL